MARHRYKIGLNIGLSTFIDLYWGIYKCINDITTRHKVPTDSTFKNKSILPSLPKYDAIISPLYD